MTPQEGARYQKPCNHGVIAELFSGQRDLLRERLARYLHVKHPTPS